jgi:hypothetical protein
MPKAKSTRRFVRDTWNGKSIYRCQHVLPSGRLCGHDSRDLAVAEAHDREHDPRPKFHPPDVASADRFGNPLSKE